jgi:thiol-disulfide isomerase/thioredoxin
MWLKPVSFVAYILVFASMCRWNGIYKVLSLNRMKIPVAVKNAGYVALGLVILYFAYRAVYSVDGFTGSSGATFSLYYADWCPHCKTVKPAFESWMSSQSLVTAKMYEADKDSAAVKAAGVKGFPTFQLKKADGTVVECNARDPAGWESFLKQNL